MPPMKPKYKHKLEERYVAMAQDLMIPIVRWIPTEENLQWLLRFTYRYKNGKYDKIVALAKQLSDYEPKTFQDTPEDLQLVLKGKN